MGNEAAFSTDAGPGRQSPHDPVTFTNAWGGGVKWQVRAKCSDRRQQEQARTCCAQPGAEVGLQNGPVCQRFQPGQSDDHRPCRKGQDRRRVIEVQCRLRPQAGTGVEHHAG